MTHTLIVGSGVAAATIARHLLHAGRGPVTMLEAGPRIPMRSRRIWLDHVMTGEDPYGAGTDPAGDFDNHGEGELVVPGSRLWARGGTTLHWGGWCPRLQPEDFALHEATGRGMDWALRYADLEPYYCEAEAELDVAGDSSEAWPPRSRPYPQPRVEHTAVDRFAMEAFDRLGYAHGHMPIARRVQSKDRPVCLTTGTCRYCPVGAKFSADQTLDRLEGQPGFSLLTGAAVARLHMQSKHVAAGVEYIDASTGRAHRLDADRIILCAGALETPKLLLASQGPHWPLGVGNDSGHVGRHLNTHVRLIAIGWSPRNPRRLAQELDFPTFCSRHFDTPAQQGEGKLFVTIGGPLIEHGSAMSEGASPAAIDARASGESTFLVQGLLEVVPTSDESRVDLAPRAGRFGTARTRLELSWDAASQAVARRHMATLEGILRELEHEPRDLRMGVKGSGRLPYAERADHVTSTCRMSRDPAQGVVDPDLRVHDVDNVFVCSNAVFPSGGAVNPTLTLTALAIRLAESLAS